MTRIKRAADALARAQDRTDTARQELHEAIREARAAGESVSLIAHVAGYTPQRVWQVAQEGKD